MAKKSAASSSSSSSLAEPPVKNPKSPCAFAAIHRSIPTVSGASPVASRTARTSSLLCMRAAALCKFFAAFVSEEICADTGAERGPSLASQGVLKRELNGRGLSLTLSPVNSTASIFGGLYLASAEGPWLPSLSPSEAAESPSCSRWGSSASLGDESSSPTGTKASGLARTAAVAECAGVAASRTKRPLGFANALEGSGASLAEAKGIQPTLLREGGEAVDFWLDGTLDGLKFLK